MVFRKLRAQLVRQLAQTGRLNLAECHVDATLCGAGAVATGSV